MADSTVDLILHPVRLRILLALADNHWSARQIAQVMPDVAQATLYRHINALAEGNILQIVEERPVRGTVEKVYALPDGGVRRPLLSQKTTSAPMETPNANAARIPEK